MRSMAGSFTEQKVTELPDKSRTDSMNSYRNVWLVLISLLILTVFSFWTFDTSGINWETAISDTFANLGIIFFQPSFSTLTIGNAVWLNLITIGLAVLTTVFSVIIALFLGLFGAENIGGERVSSIIQGVVAIIRSIPTVLWVLIFAITIGLGSVAAVLGCSLHAISYLAKMFSESFEDMENDKIEALKASGASFWQIVFQSIIPMTINALTSWTFMRLEINYSVALAMGAAAGAGGLGFNLFMAGSFYYDMHEIGAIMYLVIITCFTFEFLSRWVKNRGVSK